MFLLQGIQEVVGASGYVSCYTLGGRKSLVILSENSAPERTIINCTPILLRPPLLPLHSVYTCNIIFFVLTFHVW